MNKVIKAIGAAIVDILIVVLILFSVVISISSITARANNGVPDVFGYTPFSVQTDSMKPTFVKGDYIFIEDCNTDELKVGDIITYFTIIDGQRVVNTHRIVEVIEDETISYYRTQGDNPETNPTPDDELQISANIVAKYTGKRIPGLGSALSFIRTQLGFFLCVLLPMIIFFVYEAIRVIMNLIAYNKEKAIEAANDAVQNAELTEEQKQKAIEEYLASIGEKQATGNESSVQTPAQDEITNAEE